MQPHTWPLTLCLACLLIATTVSATPVFLEDFSTPGSTAGWVAWPEGELVLSEDSGNLLWCFGPLQSGGSISADSTTSNGHFAGDLTAGGATFLGMDVRPDPGTQFTMLNVYVDSPSSTWYYDLTAALPKPGTWTHFVLPLSSDPGHWIRQMGTESLRETLTNVQMLTVEIGLENGGGLGRIDNLELGHTPEPATLALLTGGVGALVLRRRASRRAA